LTDNEDEKILAGLPYSPKQLFWISFGQVWCTKYRDEALKSQILTAYHSPGEFRVIGPLSNNQDFANDFNCPLGSKMNPEQKCAVW
jgi:membrane metallo-endopeptidase-like protein 1